MSDDATILVAEDEDYLRDLLATALRFAGFEVILAADGLQAMARIDAARPDLVVLDVMMPGVDGFDVLRRLRDRGDDTPVILLTALDAEANRVEGFVRGGDDYVTKPFSLEELIGRIRAVLRRTQGPTNDRETRATLRYEDLELDERAHRVRRNGEVVELSPTEFQLLRYLLLNPEQVLSKEQILRHVWHDDLANDGSVVETFVSYLRKKVDRGRRPLIQTVRGAGYVLRRDP